MSLLSNQYPNNDIDRYVDATKVQVYYAQSIFFEIETKINDLMYMYMRIQVATNSNHDFI